MKFLIATSNPGKVREFREMLTSDSFHWIGLKDLAPLAEIEETGHTFRANAILKAQGYAMATKLWTLADDSGLEVDALNKSPGVYSARWSQMHNTGDGDVANNALLLDQLKNIPAENRSARFVCVLAIADPAGTVIWTTRATMEGRIGFAPVGSNGFGYDPLFKVAGLDQTSAELPPAEKHRISHRGKAMHLAKQLLESVDFNAISRGFGNDVCSEGRV
jgi:XTP/dITP diphosphohydrolase